MPRSTKPRKTAAQRAAAKLAAEVAARPFAVDSTAPYGAMQDGAKLAVARSIAADKAAGLSGDELRRKYGERLSGPARRKVLREHSLASASTIAPSYNAYRDGEPRQGSRHAIEHGSRAEERRAVLAAEQAEAEAIAEAKARRAAAAKARREARKASAK